jgi:hypothetical protein
MLKLLLDEEISPMVASELRRSSSGVVVYALTEWEGCDFAGVEDAICLREAAAQGLTLVTYDRNSIPLLLKAWAEEGEQHGGAILVDGKSISQADVSGLVYALASLAKEAEAWEWTNRVFFLHGG